MQTSTMNERNHTNESDYFEEAKDWAYERYQIQEVMANRWQLAFWLAMIVSMLLLAGYFFLLPLKSWEPIVINHNAQTGEVWVNSLKNHYLPETSSEIESDLVRYVVARETFSLIDNIMRSRQVQYTSSTEVAKFYNQNQDSNNPQSSIRMYGSKGIRTVKIQDIVFLDNFNKAVGSKTDQADEIPTLARVDFITTETRNNATIQKYWVATVKFEYNGVPEEKEVAWLNWNGFTVTSYRVDQRNI